MKQRTTMTPAAKAAAYAIGTTVIVRELDDTERETRVRGTPWRRYDDVEVLLVEGKHGAWPLDRVRLAPQLELPLTPKIPRRCEHCAGHGSIARRARDGVGAQCPECGGTGRVR